MIFKQKSSACQHFERTSFKRYQGPNTVLNASFKPGRKAVYASDVVQIAFLHIFKAVFPLFLTVCSLVYRFLVKLGDLNSTNTGTYPFK